ITVHKHSTLSLHDALPILDQEAQSRFDASFANLEGEQMDEILTDFQKGEVEMDGLTSEFFFQLLRSATLEGAYADPIYSGNNNIDRKSTRLNSSHVSISYA